MTRKLLISLLLLHLEGETMIELTIDQVEWTDPSYYHQN